MGNCCLKKPAYRVGTINEEVRYKCFNEWYQESQKQFFKIIKIKNEKKKQHKLFQKKKLNMAKTIDDLSKGKSANFDKMKLEMKSEHLKQLQSNQEFIEEVMAQRRENVCKRQTNFWDHIQLDDIQTPKNLDIRNKEYKHIIRKNFDLIHWDVLLRIMQVNNQNDQKKNFVLIKNQIDMDYKTKYDSIFKKSRFKSRNK
jgi:hypothetical protein